MGGLFSSSTSGSPPVNSLKELFGDTLLTRDGEKKMIDVLGNSRLILVYFSAHWCPPCRKFTPVLIEFYNTLKSDGRNIELVFISSDRSLSEFDSYYASMPWTALPFGSPKISELSSRYSISGIPMLIVISPSQDFHLVDAQARSTVSSCKYPDQALNTWGMSTS